MGNPHLHGSCNFTEYLAKTVIKSLSRSCRSELTRQGISLFVPFRRRTISSPDRMIGARRMVSEGSRERDFPADSPMALGFQHIAMIGHISSSLKRKAVVFCCSPYNRPSPSPLQNTEAANLRTIIVIAGVHQRLDSRLPTPCGAMTSPRNVLTLASPQPLYIAFLLRRDLCFW